MENKKHKLLAFFLIFILHGGEEEESANFEKINEFQIAATHHIEMNGGRCSTLMHETYRKWPL
ncbi:hypothetical protein KFK09_006682 [Dendrobium nobile]|uniref:Uncharacterized protein n=1 Tax=Dendrobium nobile TaxID=94219 RepID=A0A8T3BS05_DENNO|nr:hypothetical protein KFK09_006682 [Dendrobium nobile]